MRKSRKIIFTLTTIFSVLTLLGLAMLMFSSRDLTDLLVDAVLLLISASSIAIAIFSQMAAIRDARRIEHLMRDINSIDRNTEEDLRTDSSFRRKLDEVLRLEKEIHDELIGKKRDKKIEKGSKTP